MPWKLQQKNVCFEARDNKFGVFTIKKSGNLKKLKLVHESGFVSCNTRFNHSKTNFGCYDGWIKTIVTDRKNKILFPNLDRASTSGFYKLTGYTPDSSELLFDSIKEKTLVAAGTEFRIWYGEDLRDVSESDNEGTSCVSVYARVEGLFMNSL